MNEIIIALDGLEKQYAIRLAKELSGKVWGFKVNDMIILHGTNIIKQLKEYGNVFADPKLHDIPNTIHNVVRHLNAVGTNMISVHISGGVDMLLAATAAAPYSRIVGITILTSLHPNIVRTIYRGYPLQRMAEMATKGKLFGIVCSGQEVSFWEQFKFVKIVPGIRIGGLVPCEDQVRHCSQVRADFVVIGRPVTGASDPLKAIEEIKRKLVVSNTNTERTETTECNPYSDQHF